MPVKLILRGKEYEVKPGMTLLDSLKKINVLSESVIATQDGEMILDDEILKDGDVVKLIAVISGGSCLCEPERQRVAKQTHLIIKQEIASGRRPRNDI
jgi:sulfur carrier protein